MNAHLTTDRFDQYLRFLARSLILARVACQDGDSARAEAVLDMAHNLPRFLLGEEKSDFESQFIALYLDPLVRRYSDLRPLADLLQ